MCFSLTTSSPLDGNDVNEQFIDIVDAYYVAKFRHQSAQSNIRHKTLEPHSSGKQVSTSQLIAYNSNNFLSAMFNIDLITTIGDKICFMKILTSYSAFIHCPKLIHFIKNVILLPI